MLEVLRSTVLIAAALLAACAGTGGGPGGGQDTGRDGDRAAADRAGAEGPALSEGGVTHDKGASLTFELGAPPQPNQLGVEHWKRPPRWPVGPTRDDDSEVGVLYAMAYFPAPSGVEIERANRLAELYADARAGYGLYSFLLGGPTDARSPVDVAAYGELLRAIDTYVMNSNGAGGNGDTGRHGFLIQVDVLRPDGELYERVYPRLSAEARLVLARQLRLYGHVALADRLEASSGPFLVTSLRPALVPMSATQPLLVVDLQPLGPEYMYSVVDVYDRPIPGDMLGRPESLAAIARRLREIFPNRQVDSGAAPAPDQEWIWLIDGSARAQAVAPITRGDSAGTASSTSRAKAPDAAIALAGARSSSSWLRMEAV
ncbi:MAG: hypothetical protein GVY22_04870 [Gammaproteobacteria bacterium]|jgi:hypothetical protein|nr:hypothetical protein [Gammaproteobacteria bacterium]